MNQKRAVHRQLNCLSPTRRTVTSDIIIKRINPIIYVSEVGHCICPNIHFTTTTNLSVRIRVVCTHSPHIYRVIMDLFTGDPGRRGGGLGPLVNCTSPKVSKKEQDVSSYVWLGRVSRVGTTLKARLCGEYRNDFVCLRV